MRSRQIISLRSVVATFLAAAMLLASGGCLFVLQLDGDCEDHCDDSCADCGDCVICLPTLHMLIAGQPMNRAADQRPSKLCLATPDHLERIFAANIDHPPQNIA